MPLSRMVLNTSSALMPWMSMVPAMICSSCVGGLRGLLVDSAQPGPLECAVGLGHRRGQHVGVPVSVEVDVVLADVIGVDLDSDRVGALQQIHQVLILLQ